MPASAADQANEAMVDRIIGQGMLWTPALIAAFRATPRHRFLDRVYVFQRRQNRWRAVASQPPEGVELLRLIYADRALITKIHRPYPGGPQTPVSSSSQPSLMAQMLEDLRAGPEMRVLEVGAGTGYNAALLGQIAGPVFSVDVDSQVVRESAEHLRAFEGRRVEFRHADGRAGLPDQAPFDRVMVTAATPDFEPAWLAQTADDGILLAPLVLAPGLAYVARGRVHAGIFEGRLTRTAWFLPLRGEDEAGRVDEQCRPAPGSLQTSPAPWADWIESRRARLSWLSLVQALAFHAWLHGCAITYDTLHDGQTAFGIRNGDAVCRAAATVWAYGDEAGRGLGERLWRAFLDAGAPWPTEYRLRASVGPLPEPNAREAYVRRGPFCWQTWELIEPRDRPARIEV